MTVSSRSLNPWRRAARLSTFIMVFTAWVFVARAQTPTPPYALLEYSSLTGIGNTIKASQIPVVTASGVIVYVTLSMKFDVNADGILTLSAGYPQLSTSPTPVTLGFVAGKYVGPSAILGGKTSVVVSGPGVTDGGATVWSLSSATGAEVCTYPSSATWYVGPIASNPLAARLKSAGITSTVWSYGVGSSQCTYGNNDWGANALIGVSQVGNTLTIVSFSSGATDSPIPLNQITYTLAP